MLHFQGSIKIKLKNRQNNKDICETLEAKETLRAFERPSVTNHRNSIGFGLQEFLGVSSVMNGGFWDSSADDLLIIAQVQPLESLISVFLS